MSGIVKFTEPQRALYLNALRKYGQKALAAEATDVSPETIRLHRKADPDFAAAEDLALKLRSQDIQSRLEREAVEGVLEPVFDKKGNAVMVTGPDGKQVHVHTRKLETGLRRMVLAAAAKRNGDTSYQQAQEVNHKVSGGVMLMPQPVPSVADWASLVESAKKQPKELPEGE